MKSPEDINKALLAFNNGGGLKKFSKHAKSKALEGKKEIHVDYSKTNKGKSELKRWEAAKKKFNEN